MICKKIKGLRQVVFGAVEYSFLGKGVNFNTHIVLFSSSLRLVFGFVSSYSEGSVCGIDA